MLSSPRSPDSTMRIFSSAENCRRVARRISLITCSADSFTGSDCCPIFAPLLATMGHQPSLPQPAASVSQALMPDRVTDGQLSQQDRDRLNQLVAAEYNISTQEAQQRVVQAEQQATQAAGQAEEKARRAADTAASSASIAAFSIFAVMLLGAIAAVLGARRGTRDLLTFRSAPGV